MVGHHWHVISVTSMRHHHDVGMSSMYSHHEVGISSVVSSVGCPRNGIQSPYHRGAREVPSGFIEVRVQDGDRYRANE